RNALATDHSRSRLAVGDESMLATWLAGPLSALLRPAVNAIAGDLWRRWRIDRRLAKSDPSKTSPVVEKAIADLEILLGKNGKLTESVANLLNDLKGTGLLDLITRDAFYEIHDEGVRVYFEALFARHTPTLDANDRRHACQHLYDTILF